MSICSARQEQFRLVIIIRLVLSVAQLPSSGVILQRLYDLLRTSQLHTTSVSESFAQKSTSIPLTVDTTPPEMAKPTILIVPGSFAPPTIYDELVRLLKAKGHPAVAVQLPSTSKRMPLAPATMFEDADVIKRAAEALINLGREVIVVAHSYGGVPMTQGLVGVPVSKIVYLTAIVPKMGQTNPEALGQKQEEMPPVTEGYMHLDAVLLAGAVCNDMAWEDAYPLVLQLAHHSEAAFKERVTQLAYKEMSVAYVVCEKDLIVSKEKQMEFIGVLEEAKGGGKVQVRSLDAGHCPNWSCPDKVVDVLVQCAEN
jgi:pimeloyl-ACP methyl ester carboxylesterase